MSEKKEAKKKVVWVTMAPNMIYVNIMNALAKAHPDVEFVLVVKKTPKMATDFRLKVVADTDESIAYQAPWKYLIQFLRKKFHFVNRYFDIPADLTGFIKEECPDLVMSNIFYSGFTRKTHQYAKKSGIPFILLEQKRFFHKKILGRIAEHGLFFFCRNVFHYASVVLCWTNHGVEFGKKHYPVENTQKIGRVTAGINTKLFYPPEKEAVQKEADTVKFLMVARMVPFKRYFDLLESFKKAKELTDKKTTLSILGNGPLEDEIKDKVKEIGLENDVNFLEKVPYEELVKTYHAHDCLVLPSEREAIGMVVPEAMASGLPVIISDTAGAKDYVRDGKDGFIFKTYDVADLTKKLLIMTDKEKCGKMGRSASQRIKENFKVEQVAEDLWIEMKDEAFLM